MPPFPTSEFKTLPDNIRESMLETLRSEHPIAVGNWVVKREDTVCGCLLTDGIQANAPDLFERLQNWVYQPHQDIRSNRAIRSIIGGFYDLDTTYYVQLIDAAMAFDGWADVSGLIDLAVKSPGKTTNGFLSDDGRKFVIEQLEALNA